MRCVLGMVVVAALVFSPRASLRADSRCEERFDEILAKFEQEKSKEPYLRIPTIMSFASASCAKTVDFLRELYATEKNPGIFVAISNALVNIGSKEAIEAVVGAGLVGVISEARVDGFALSQVGDLLRRPMASKAEDWLLTKGLRIPALRKNATTSDILLMAAAARQSPKRVSILAREIASARSPELQAAILESLAEHPDKAVARLGAKFTASKDERVLVAAYDILRVAHSKTYRKYFLKGLKSRLWQVRVLSVDALFDIGEKSILRLVLPLLRDEDKRVQVSVVRVLLQHGGTDVMEPLIEALSYTTGRVLDDVADALARLTGHDLGPYAAQWESWWGVNKNRLTSAELVALPAQEFSALKDAAQDKATLLYHGLRVLSNFVAFIIDSSESMKKEYVPKKSSKRRSGAGVSTEVVGAANAGKNSNRKQRMEVARDELTQVLRRLEAGKSFNVLAFNTFTADFNTNVLVSDGTRLATMEPVARAKALGFVTSARAEGLTNLSGALEAAFAYSDVDTIFLLSDGTPEGGGITDHEELLRAVRRWNRLSKIKINIIGFDLDDKTRFLMERLADQNFGVFVER